MSKTKNNSKKIVAPMKIKEEKTGKNNGNELKELTHYIDDRVALMHQVFLTIKPKKLKSMAPDCLKDMDIDKIKELCLEEVLGISTKRLKSIIQGTECPSDTNSDSDMDEIIEHISLEEISSDDSVAFMSDNETSKKNEAPPNKEMTVLELVELQARARAIRSQLALEPVKKEIAEAKNKGNANKSNKSKTHSTDPKPVDNNTVTNNSPKAGASTKLVRNYRSRDVQEIIPNKDSIELQNKEDITKELPEKQVVSKPLDTEDGEIHTSEAEKSEHSEKSSKMNSKKKKKSHTKRNSSKDQRTRHIEINKKSLTVNVSFNDKEDEDEINLYVSDTEKEQLLSGTATVSRRISNDSESSVSIIDLNNSPLIISSESENDFQDKGSKENLDSGIVDLDKSFGDADENTATLDIKQEDLSKEANLNSKSPVNDKEQNVDDNAKSKESDDDLSSDECVEENTDWKTRWMNSDKVKRVLVTSKLCSNVKKKQTVRKTSDENEETNTNDVVDDVTNVEITGSVADFAKLSCIAEDSSDAVKENIDDKMEESVNDAVQNIVQDSDKGETVDNVTCS